MRKVSSTVVIDSGAEAVWRLLSEPERYPDYVPAAERLLAASDPFVHAGSTYREYGGIPPFLGESDWVVTEYDPMHHQHHDGDDGKVRMLLDLDVDPLDDEHTRLTISLELRPHWFMAVPSAILWPLLMKRRAQEVIDGTVSNAKHLVEVGEGT